MTRRRVISHPVHLMTGVSLKEMPALENFGS